MALNVTMYLLLKGDQQNYANDESHEFAEGVNDASTIQAHPVMARLQQLNSMTEKLEDKVESKVNGLSEQITNLVKAAALMKSEQHDPEQDLNEDDSDEAPEESPAETGLPRPGKGDDESDSSQELESDINEGNARQHVLNEAKFGLREAEVAASVEKHKKRKRRRVAFEDFADDDADGKPASSAFASTINAIEQRANSKSRRPAPVVEQLDGHDDVDDDELRRGLELMEKELGRGSDDDDESEGEGYGDIIDHEVDEGEDNAFYNQIALKSSAKKKFKQSLYQVAPKYPGMENEVEGKPLSYCMIWFKCFYLTMFSSTGERPLSRAILKNRGLVPHKNKLNRNPRVKKREQYRKALIRRRGAVRDIRTDEGHKYGGEATGIKSGLSRSRKLASP